MRVYALLLAFTRVDLHGLDAIEPGDEVARHLVAVGLVERLVPSARIDAGRELGEAWRLQVFDEALDGGANRVALAGEDVDRQVLADRGKALSARDVGERIEHVDPELGCERKAAERIGDKRVDFLLVAREPVGAGARRLERLVEFAEPELKDRVAFAALPEPHALLAGDQPPQRRNHRRPAVRSRKRSAGQRVRMLGDEPAPEERA